MISRTLRPRSIPRSKNADTLHAITRSILRKKCWRAELSYGGELVLHFGKRIPVEHPKMPGESEGEWILGTLGTGWILSTPREQISSVGQTDEFLEQKIPILEESRVTGFRIHGDVLTVAFSSGCTLRIVPDEEDREEDDDPYWELFTPGNMYVEFGRDGVWSYKRSNLSMT